MCQDNTAGSCCQFCTDPSNPSCKVQCTTGFCTKGEYCVYLSGNTGPWECGACLVGWGQPDCADCAEDFLKVDGNCYKRCYSCQTGNCYYDKDGEINCIQCHDGTVGTACDQCLPGFQLYNNQCCEIQDPEELRGHCIAYQGDIICLSCNEGQTLYNQRCLYSCSTENCIYGVCQPDTNCKCDSFAEGNNCEICSTGAADFEGKCTKVCTDCDGDCYSTGSDGISCKSCAGDLIGPTCSDCAPGFMSVNGECFQYCETCRGNRCYVGIALVLNCLGDCYLGYFGRGCDACDVEDRFELQFGGCYRKCTDCTQGNCFLTENGPLCTKCALGLIGIQCDSCAEGFVQDQAKCWPKVGQNDCYLDELQALICVGCAADYLLIGSSCLEKCTLPECTGRCYMLPNDYKCLDCFPNFVLYEEKCYEQDSNPHGVCFTTETEKICSCYEGYKGPTCGECTELQLRDSCYIDANIPTGDCFQNAADPSDLFCSVCAANFALPLCDKCAEGYETDFSGVCQGCSSGYFSSNLLPDEQKLEIGEDLCLRACDSCSYGVCFYSGSRIVCASCQTGYKLQDSCQTCDTGFLSFGVSCIQQVNESCGSDWDGNIYCFECDNLQQSFNCQQCSVQFNFQGVCKQHASNFADSCALEGSNIVYADGTCRKFDKLKNMCVECDSTLVNIKGNCGVLTVPQNGQLRGRCIASVQRFWCDQCDEGWSGNVCSECAKGYMPCKCTSGLFALCCCKVELGLNGVCYSNEAGRAICVSCSSRYQLSNQECVKIGLTKQYVLSFFVPASLGLLILLALILIIFLIGKEKRKDLQIFVKKLVKRLGVHLIFVILSQILAVIVAIQDVYIDDFFMQTAVSIFSMLPFALLFVFLAPPVYKRYFFNMASHFYLFILAAAIQVSFNAVQYLAVTDIVQDFGEQIYKLAGPPITLLLCIFLARFRFKPQQKLALFIGLGLPLATQIYYAIQDSMAAGYFTGSSAGNAIIGQAMVLLAIILSGTQFYVFDLILGRYGEVGAIYRISLSSFCINAVVGLLYPGEILTAILQYDIFFSSLLTQMLFNVVNIIVMMRISAVEFSINLISSAIWAQFIAAVGDYYYSQNNNYLSTPIHVILQTFALVIVFVSLTYFNIRSSYWYHRKNVRQAKELETEVSGVMPFIKTAILKKKARSQTESGQFNDNVESPTSQTRRNIMNLDGNLPRKGTRKPFISSKNNVLDSNELFGTKQYKSQQNSQNSFTGIDSKLQLASFEIRSPNPVE
ncbi:Transmembrane domain-containing protein [Spironucleus salmonicida]|uniref:Transmembrane domain-containing protein n=1 Tax=Spironucleus salmonicida TaxID=348837 RepID=A0A9P8LWW1_9EUKA|nr:Transmembrane domain-containing protein [Spironucleus salmonicida]